MPPTRDLTKEEIRILDLFKAMKLPQVIKDSKRPWTYKHKAQVLGIYDALPNMSAARGILTKEYRLHWGMLKRWRGELKANGMEIPNFKMDAPVMNGAAPAAPAKRAGLKPGRKPRGTFQSVDDAIAWLKIREDEARKIREELEQHAGKTRNE